MKRPVRRPEKIIFKLALYIFLLVGVFMALIKVNSQSFKGSLENLFNSVQGQQQTTLSLKQKTNWCPSEFEGKEYCEIESESFDKDLIPQISFHKILIPGKNRGNLLLEQGENQQKDFFRFQGLVFKSPELAAKLSKYKEYQ